MKLITNKLRKLILNIYNFFKKKKTTIEKKKYKTYDEIIETIKKELALKYPRMHINKYRNVYGESYYQAIDRELYESYKDELNDALEREGDMDAIAMHGDDKRFGGYWETIYDEEKRVNALTENNIKLLIDACKEAKNEIDILKPSNTKERKIADIALNKVKNKSFRTLIEAHYSLRLLGMCCVHCIHWKPNIPIINLKEVFFLDSFMNEIEILDYSGYCKWHDVDRSAKFPVCVNGAKIDNPLRNVLHLLDKEYLLNT